MKRLIALILLIILALSLCACSPSQEELEQMNKVSTAIQNWHFKYEEDGKDFILTFDEDTANLKIKSGGNTYFEEYKYQLKMGKNYYKEKAVVIDLKNCKRWDDMSVRLDTEGVIMDLNSLDGKVSFTRIR